MEDDRSGDRTGGTGDGKGRSTEPVRYGRSGQSSGVDHDGGVTPDPTTASSNERYCPECGTAIAGAAEMCPECGAGSENRTGDGDGQAVAEPSGRYVSALAGGAVSFVVGWIPLVGPAIGGGVAGYLRGSDAKESAISGLIGNVVASIPMMGLAALFLILGGIGAASEGDGEVALGLFLWAAIFAASFTYFFVLGAAGGALGAAFTSRRAP